jgi:glyoxylase-like metal-dependent hydrolase (beta-lactamase superfamily II)
MFFRQRANPDASLSYFFGCAGKGFAAAVDVVAGDEAWYVDEARKLGVAITYVIDTHIHADHLSGGRELARLSGAAFAMHESNQGKTSYAFMPLADGQNLPLGNTQIQVLHTPGHTMDSLCLLVTDLRRGPEPWFVLTGDTLFVGSVGRPDLAGREQIMAGVLWDSLQTKLLSLPIDLEVFPGHQSGSPCGADLSGKPSSTIGFEKRFNKLLSMDRAEFITALTAAIPSRPDDMDRLVAVNLGHEAAAIA